MTSIAVGRFKITSGFDSEVVAKRGAIAGTTALFFLLAFMPMRLAAYPHDALIQLEGAWRLEQGQRLYTQSHTPLGALYPLLLQLGIKLFGLTPRAFLVPALLPLPFLSALSWSIFRPRFTRGMTVVLVLFVGSILVGPTCLGDPILFGQNWLRTTFGMQYNRVFWPLCLLLATLALVPRQGARSDRDMRFESVCLGSLFALCFFAKVNFFVASAPLIVIAFWNERTNWRWFVGFAAGAGAIFLAFALLGVSVPGYLADLGMLSKAQSIRERIGQISYLTAVNLEYVLGIAAVVLALRWRGPAWMPISALILVVYGIVITSANYQDHFIPTMALALFVLVEYARRDAGFSYDLLQVAKAAVTAITGGWIGLTVLAFLPAYANLPDALMGRNHGVTGSAYSAFYQDSFVGADAASLDIIRRTDTQARACDRLFGSNGTVFHLGWYNVLPVLRHAPSPSGLLWYHDGRTVTRKTLPPPERELDGVDGVVWPTDPEGPDNLIIEAYGPYVTTHFVPLATDETATYWRRR